ncbi:DUF3574 domain-containing protein [Asaia bogorensis]|uniref:DUF3574 domain-containing protein n=1 Tax=Asaia bogorensis TaxID=91915 RepID=UPI001F11CDC4|nr:DUF3574 domain-containing protein [Asaia bogorensis]
MSPRRNGSGQSSPASGQVGRVSRVALLGLLTGFAGCTASPEKPVTPDSACITQNILTNSREMLSITLAFGLADPDGRTITSPEWSDFLAREVTSRFPAGLSVVEAQGQWQDRPGGMVTHEPARLVWILTPETATLAPAIAAIRDAYKRRFNQQSVGAFIHSGCASF